MILLIDNYDSFTYNLYQYLSELGAEVIVERNDKINIKEIEDLNPSRILISPGPCTPREAGISNEVVINFGNRVPILGVCLGHQCIGFSFGGIVDRAGEIVHGKTSEIFHDGKGVLKNILYIHYFLKLLLIIFLIFFEIFSLIYFEYSNLWIN